MLKNDIRERGARVGEYLTKDNQRNCYLVGDMYRIFKQDLVGGGDGEKACDRHDIQEISTYCVTSANRIIYFDEKRLVLETHGMDEISYLVCHDAFL